jgi:hypothetical protein
LLPSPSSFSICRNEEEGNKWNRATSSARTRWFWDSIETRRMKTGNRETYSPNTKVRHDLLLRSMKNHPAKSGDAARTRDADQNVNKFLKNATILRTMHAFLCPAQQAKSDRIVLTQSLRSQLPYARYHSLTHSHLSRDTCRAYSSWKNPHKDDEVKKAKGRWWESWSSS